MTEAMRWAFILIAVGFVVWLGMYRDVQSFF
jgi:hypothetical protein